MLPASARRRVLVVAALSLLVSLHAGAAHAQPALPPPTRYSSDVSTPTGTVTESRRGMALVDFHGASGLYVGLYVAVRPPGYGNVLARASEPRVVAVIDALLPEGVLIRFGDSERVDVGDVVVPTTFDPTSTTLAPAPLHRTVRVLALVGPAFRSSGVLGQLDLAYYGGTGFAFVSTMPSGVLRGDPSDAFGIAGIVGGGLHDRFYEVGLGAALVSDSLRDESYDIDGFDLGRDVGVGLALRLRVGALDGLAFTSDVMFRLGERGGYSTTPRMDFGIQGPLGDRVIAGMHGGLWFGQGGYSDLHTVMRIRLRGRGGPGTIYGVLDLSVLWPRSCLDCIDSDYGSSDAVPALQAGIDARFGPGRSAD